MGASKKMFIEQREALQFKISEYETRDIQFVCRRDTKPVQDNKGGPLLKKQRKQSSGR